MLVVFSLLLFFPHNSALENWQIYLCNRFSPPKGDKTCIIDRHPLWLEGLEPTIEEWSKAAQEHVRIMTSVGENDVVSRAAGANGDEPVFVGCRKPHRPGDINSHYINSGSWRPIFKYIKGFADNTVVLKNLFKINRVAPAENGDQISIIDLPFSFQCIKDDALKPTARTPHYFYPISMLQTARKSVIGDTLEVSDLKKSLPIKSEEHNLKVDIGWGDWSCCSTCCCPNEFCSIGFGFSKHKCDAIESRQTRVGYVSFMKINTSEPIDIAKNFTDHNPELSPREIKEAIQEFEEMLMDTVVPSVPIFSHVFFGSAKLRKLEKTLQRIFPEAQRGNADLVAPTDAYPFGRFGKVIQTRICDDKNPQKTVCAENERCKKLWHLRLEFNPYATSTASPNTTNNAWKDSCLSVDFTDLVITDVEEEFSVIPGVNYRLNLGENLLSEGDNVSWQLGANTIPDYDWTKSCSEQDLVVTPDHRSVIILGITEDFQHVVIAASMSSKNTSKDYFVKFSVVLPELPSEHKVKIVQWAIVGGGVILVLVGLVSFQIYYELQKKRKLKKESEAEEPAEQNEEAGGLPDGAAPSNVPPHVKILRSKGYPSTRKLAFRFRLWKCPKNQSQ